MITGAAQGVQLAVLQWAVSNGFAVATQVDCLSLAKGGHLACLQWAVAQGSRVSWRMCALAAFGGHLHVLQWLHDNGSWTQASALNGGHLEVFEWARQQGTPVCKELVHAAAKGSYAEVLQWALECAGERIKPDPLFCEIAGNTQVLKVLREHGYEWSKKTCAEFAKRGELELLQWARHNGCPWDWATCSQARIHNNSSHSHTMCSYLGKQSAFRFS